jgi:Raf kinase inhibitor-like YbhB/YbcL family protein
MGNTENNALIVSSLAFEDGGNIPSKYTCEGEDINPPLEVDNLPEETKTLAIIVEDPDAPNGTFDHWLVWNIPPRNPIEENRTPGVTGTNSAKKTGYYGPCPPSGIHRYFFYVFALNESLDLKEGADKQQLRDAIEKHVLAIGVLMGTYQREENKK